MATFVNIVSNKTAPTRVNQNQFVPLETSSSDSWEVSGRDLVCKNAGVWQFTSQYQILNINSVDSGLDARLVGWFNINGKNVKDSAAVSYASKVEGTAVLTLALAFEFKEGDKLRFGIRSESTDGNLNIVISEVQTGAKVNAPSIIVSAIKTA
jgi:hypothetical protein